MCGIVGYIGSKKALPFLLSGLKNLEYRGYDSCGIALLENQRIKTGKVKGGVDRLIKKTTNLETQAQTGIGHTRWATHGKPSVKNAHPQLDCKRKIAVVHNGIIENFEELKSWLEKKGHHFTSETDTEVLAHLIEEEVKKGFSLKKAVINSLKKLVGAYGIAVLSADFPEQIVAARLSSPLVIGLGKKENFLASDQPALVGWTKNLIMLKDNQIAVIKKDKVDISYLNGQKALGQKFFIEQKTKPSSKGKYPHFTLKEIYEQPEIIKRGLSGRFNLKTGKVKLGGVENSFSPLANAPFITIVASGTSYYAGLLGKIFFQKIAQKTILVENAAQTQVESFHWRENQPVIFISQSGETADVLTVLRKAKRAGALTFGLVNTVGSSIAREAGQGVYLRAGFEIGVASTKTFSAQVLALLLWSIALAQNQKKKIDPSLISSLGQTPLLIKKILNQEKKIKKLACQLYREKKIFLLGRGISFPLALEGALKIKELAYLPAEGIQLGEFKHGPLALVDKKTILLALVPDDDHFEKNLNNLHEINTRGGRLIIATNKPKKYFSKLKNTTLFPLPACHKLLACFPTAVFLQLLAYWLARQRHCPIDKPRNLAKSVTVE